MVKVIKGKNDFASMEKELMKEWNWDKNVVDPSSFHVGHNEKVWWKCSSCNFEWQALTQNRRPGKRKGNGCPKCAEIKRANTKKNKIKLGGTSLLACYPDIAKQWHPILNENLSPDEIGAHSKQKVWWKGLCGHEWQASIGDRTRGTDCPKCSVKKIKYTYMKTIEQSGKSLYELYPQIALEWHPYNNSNIDYTPNNISAHSGKKVWWLGKCGHEWQAVVSSRTNGTGCPFCQDKKNLAIKNRIISNGKSLKNLYPEIAKEWNYKRNKDCDYSPDNIGPYSNVKIWWCCDFGHEWQTSPHNRIKNKKIIGCPYCSHRLIDENNSFGGKYPELVKEWDFEKNTNISPYKVAPHSSLIAWWLCKNGHSYKKSIATKTSNKGCPVCNRERRTSFPEYAILFYLNKVTYDVFHSYIFSGTKEIDIFIPDLNIGIEYDGVFFHKNKKRDLEKNKLCKDMGILLYRIREKGLEKLEDSSIDIIVDNNLNQAIDILIFDIFKVHVDINIDRDRIEIEKLQFIKDKESSLFANYPELSKEWNQNKNGNRTPYNTKCYHSEKVWWTCELGHEYKATTGHRIEGTGCPYCANNSLLTGFNDLYYLFPNVAEEWHPTKNNNLKPTDVIAYTPRKVWWLGKCGHQWKAGVNTRISGTGCPICLNRTIISGVNDLEKWCLDNPKFKYILEEWNYEKNSNIKPNNVAPHSSKKVWWQCSVCRNDWQVKICERTSVNKSGCPYCKNQKIKSGFNDLLTKEPELCKEWNYEKNVNIKPSNISCNSGKKVWWKCKLGHEWEATIDNRRGKGKGCPFCSNKKVLPGYNDLESLRPDISKDWDFEKNINLIPSQIYVYSNKKVWWKCAICNFEWETQILLRTKRGLGKCRKCKDQI